MLKKELGLFSVFSLAAGTMISSGLFVLPGIAFAVGGPSIVLSYALAGVLMIPLLLSKSELASAMPKSGGSYFYIERSLGPLMGTIAGLANWFSIALKATFALIGMAAMIRIIYPDTNDHILKLAAIGLCIGFTLLNFVSVKSSGKFQNVLVIFLITILAVYFGKAVTSESFTVHRFEPFMPKGFQSMFAVTGMVFISFGGLSKVVSVAEEVKQSTRNLIIGMFLAFVVVILLYICVVFVTVGCVEPSVLSGSLVPIKLGGEIAMGNIGIILISLAAFFAFATTANAGVMSAARTPMAMSRDGLLPEFFSLTSKKYHTPGFALILTGIFMIITIALLDIEKLVKTASAMMIMMFIMDHLSVVIMRLSKMQSYRPTFKAPFTPWIQIVTIVIYVFLILEMGYTPIAITAGFSLLAVIWYLFYVQRKMDRESAIVYLVKRIVSRNITQRSGLEDELKQIALERDEITFDRFDSLVQKCKILDIQEAMKAKEFFKLLAKELERPLNTSENKLYEMFLDRERESTTVINPGLAIPHIIIDGENIFEMILVRCKAGVEFSELQEPVRTAFVLIGSQDQRNFHLKALMNIAHTVSSPNFEQRWFEATNIEQLRDIIMLSGRKRHDQ